jgi:hypothetical protein
MIEVDLNKCGIAWENFSDVIYEKYNDGTGVDEDVWEEQYLPDLNATLKEFNGSTVLEVSNGIRISGLYFQTEEDYLFFCLKWS